MYQPQMISDGDCGENGGMKIGSRGNRRTRRKPAQRHFVHHKSHITKPGCLWRNYRLEINRDIISDFVHILRCLSNHNVSEIGFVSVFRCKERASFYF
jgi:hypothetical protein